jgi:AmmeMemoRadiSam system protein A
MTKEMSSVKSESSPHVKLARAAIEQYVRRGRVIDVAADTADELKSVCAGAFVCLKRHGSLRGCIGTIEPVRRSLAEEIIENAISAATRDPRFLPVEPEELDDLDVSVDVLFPPEPIDGPEQLDPKRYGVIVEHGGRRGLLLPDLDGVDTVEQQVEIARHKAFIGHSEPIKLYRFEVKRHE